MTQQKISLVLGDNPTTRPITEDGLGADNLDIEHLSFEPIHRAFKPMLREQRFDVSELAIIAAMQAVAFGEPIMILPVTLAARFQHGCIIQDSRRAPLAPEALAGKRVGVRAYTQTTGAWVRAILAREHGVQSRDVEWITNEDPHVAQYRAPANVTQISADADLLSMLENGEIDAAIFGNDLPKHDWVKSVIPSPAEAAQRAFADDGVVPINHMVVASKAFAQARPDDLRALYDLFKQSKTVALHDSTGPDLRPIGFAAVRTPVSILLEEAFSQDLLPRRISFDELFADAMTVLGTDA